MSIIELEHLYIYPITFPGNQKLTFYFKNCSLQMTEVSSSLIQPLTVHQLDAKLSSFDQVHHGVSAVAVSAFEGE